jgi:Na+/H+ antiporter NhaD/arsenite permease-like protein
MTTLTISIIVVFVLGYALIATESLTKVNKAAIALLMLVGCWTLYMMDPMQYLQLMHPDYTGGAAGMVEKVTGIIQEHLGDTATTLFFLMGAMTIVEIVDQNGGFNWVRKVMKTKSKRALLWRIAILTFFLSAILDNLTTSIVMIMILRKLVTDHKDRMVYASLVIIAANSGGAFSPIGDVTTIMLWNKGLITAAGVIAEIFIPSVVSMVIPALILQTMLKGELVMPEVSAQQNASVSDFTEGQRKAVFWLGVGGLIFVPIFKSITHLPPFVGILLVLGVLWTATEVFYRGLHRGADAEGTQKRVTKLLSRVDMSTILFFLGILMAVSCLAEIGVLTALGQGLNVVFDGNHYLVTGIIGVLAALHNGEKSYFDAEQVKLIMKNNCQFEVIQPIDQYFMLYFELVENEREGEYLTAAEIFDYLKKQIGSSLKVNSLMGFGRKLANMSELKHKRFADGMKYLVKKK